MNTWAKVDLKRKYITYHLLFSCFRRIDNWAEGKRVVPRSKQKPRMWGVDWGRTPSSILPAVCMPESQGTRCLLQWLCFAHNYEQLKFSVVIREMIFTNQIFATILRWDFFLYPPRVPNIFAPENRFTANSSTEVGTSQSEWNQAEKASDVRKTWGYV